MNNLRDSAGEDKPSDEKPGGARRSRFDHFNDFIDHGKERLRKLGCASAAMLWVTLWRFENADTGLVRVSARTLAQSDGTDDTKSVRRMLTQLEDHGFLEVVDPGKPGRGSCATYRLHGAPIIGGTMPPIRKEDKGGMAPPISAEKGARRTVKGGMVPPVQKRTEKRNTEERGSAAATAATERGSSEKAGKPPEGNPHRQAIAVFCDLWQGKFGKKYAFQGGKDARAVEFILSALDGAAEFEEVVNRYLADTDPFNAKNGYSLGLLRTRVNAYRIAAPAHQPICGDRGASQEARMAAQIAEAMTYAAEVDQAQQAPAAHALNPDTRALGPIAPKIAIPAQPPAARVPVPKALATPEFCDLWHAIVADPRNGNVPAGDAQAKLEALVAVGADKALSRLRRAREEKRTLNLI